MADVKISELTANTAPVSADVFPMVETASTTTKKVSFTNLVAAIAAFLKTLTNTTFDTAGTGNVFKINGTSITDKTGTGKVVLDTSPQISAIELGNASDTTLTRSAAGTLAVEGVDVVTTSASQTMTNKTLTTPTITKPVMDATNPTRQNYTPSAAGTATLDLALSNQHHITMPAGNITIALSNDTNNQVFTVSILQDGTGSRTVTWFSTIRWVGGLTPTLTTTASKRDVFGFMRTGSGTYDGFIIGQAI